MIRTQHWSIGIYTGDSPFTVRSPASISNPVLTAKHVTDMATRFVADPFMIRHGGGWYMFFEALEAKTGRGKIACARSGDGFRWSYDRVVLSEPFHLSYPYVFAWNDEVYMVPETGEARAVRLYRASEFPIRWELVGNLLSGSPNVDSSLIYYHDQWWMFTVDNDDQDRLRLYRAEGIEGPWVEHPKSPVVSCNPHIARPAGRLVEHEGRLFRFAQDDFPEYGRHVWAIEITHLTEAEYSERLFLERPILRGRRFGWNARGMHHIDPHMLDDKRWIASVDGYRRVLSIFSPTRE